MVRGPARRQVCLKSGHAHVFHAPNHGQPSATLGDLMAREVAQWILGMAHILENGIVEKSTGQRSLSYPWGAL